MTAIEQSILQTLDELDGAVRKIPSGGSKPNLLPIFEKLDRLAAELPKGSNPELAHYLTRKSYEKARLLLREMSR